MRRPLQAYLVLAVLFWQALSWVAPHAVNALAEQLAHEVVHVQDLDHHHHADASLHLADDLEEPAHFHADNGSFPVGLIAPAAIHGFVSLPCPLPVARVAEPPPAPIDGWLRPPRTSA
jgi:hypothetical protein